MQTTPETSDEGKGDRDHVPDKGEDKTDNDGERAEGEGEFVKLKRRRRARDRGVIERRARREKEWR